MAATASRLGILNTAAFSFAYLARAEWVAGAWDDALLHAERAVAINLESDFGFMQAGGHRHRGAGAGRPRATGRPPRPTWPSMTRAGTGYERSVVALGMSRARIGEARGEPAAVVAALEPVRRFPVRDAVDEPGFWPWQDLYADALVAVGRIDGGRRVPRSRTRSWRRSAAAAPRSPGWPGPAARIEAAPGSAERAEAAFARALEATTGLPVPFERARIELAAGRFLRRAGQRRRAADLLAAAQQRFAALGAAPYAERCAAGAGRVRAGPDRAGSAAIGPG